MNAKTCLQTNTAYEPRTALAVDSVIVHRHGEEPARLAQIIGSWKQHGYTVGRMFFADSDAANEYWTGKWDGVPRPQEVERDEKGEVRMCAGVRPYMLPTEGWIRYLEEMAVESVNAGADAVLPEEPLAHVDTGYEEAFRRIWVERYGRPWQAENSSPEARYLTAQLKNELYVKLEERLCKAVQRRSREIGRKVDFVLPIHSIYSNVASRLAAPLGTSWDIKGLDGYIGQIWTGPVNWAVHNYDSPDKTFFDSAYCLYDFFVAVAGGGNRKLWLLVDPVEDDPNHTWSEFEEWYIHCTAAMLMFTEVDSYEVMPWPERIFVKGHTTGGGTPAPERFRTIVLSATQVLQDVPLGGTWNPHLLQRRAKTVHPAEGIGVAVSDTLMWEKEPPPPLQVAYGLMMPLVTAGMPASACLLERTREPKYLSRFKAIVLSYEAFKPMEAEHNTALARWVKSGGVLVVVGPADDLGGADLWWRKAGYPSPLHHLIAELGLTDVEAAGEFQVGKGWVLRRPSSPREFGRWNDVQETYLPLLQQAWSKTGSSRELETPGYLCVKRGPFVIARAGREALKLPGVFVNVVDPQFTLVTDVELKPGASGIYRDVTDILGAGNDKARKPQVLHTTHRLIEERSEHGRLRVVIRGPLETPGLLRLSTAGRKLASLTARDRAGNEREVGWTEQDQTILAHFPNEPAGVVVEVAWR
ncbi:MAG: hypothetical protein JXL80_11020 [Planctomycetes bacterium]|nr:hypothetical protein [Planctomycetota bacterium]